MSNRIKRLFILISVVLLTVLYWGCTQPPDVLVPVSLSEVTLFPQLLPTNFPGMHYELWVANGGDTASLGKFGYNNTLKKFVELNGSDRANGNLFTLEDDIYRFSKIFISVETNVDPAPNSPGSIMLIDDVTIPSNAAVDLVFPLNEELWEATARYNMETTSDSDRSALDGYGLWFASYQQLDDSVRDTFSLDSFWLDSIYENFPRDTTIVNLINIANITDKDTTRLFGVDSFTNHVVRYERITEATFAGAGDSVLITIPNFMFTVGSRLEFDYDQFTQDSFALPDYTAYGWKYKGWVVSPYVAQSNVGAITLPAWQPNTINDSLMPGINGGLLTTGTFSKINAPDDANPYALSERLPQFPGEDFLLFPSGWSGLVPNASGNSGTVFIAIEPNNFVSDTTNFPLIAFTGKVPSDRFEITGSQVIINMRNRTQITDPRLGFPRIRVDIKTF